MSKAFTCTARGAAILSLPLAALLMVLYAGNDAPRVHLTNTSVMPITAHVGTN